MLHSLCLLRGESAVPIWLPVPSCTSLVKTLELYSQRTSKRHFSLHYEKRGLYLCLHGDSWGGCLRGNMAAPCCRSVSQRHLYLPSPTQTHATSEQNLSLIRKKAPRTRLEIEKPHYYPTFDPPCTSRGGELVFLSATIGGSNVQGMTNFKLYLFDFSDNRIKYL